MSATPKAAAYPLRTDQWMNFRWERGTRFYAIHLEQDLWGAWFVTRTNGRRGSALGRAVGVPVDSREHALEICQTTARRRMQRGYELIGQNVNH